MKTVRQQSIEWWNSLTPQARKILWKEHYPEYENNGISVKCSTGRTCEYIYKQEVVKTETTKTKQI